MKLNRQDLYMELCELSGGLAQYTAWSKKHNNPVGFVWLRFVKGKPRPVAEIIECYVPKWARRQGVMYYLTHWLEKKYTLLTGQGSAEGGRAFLTARGFRRIKGLGWWVKP